MEAINQTLSHHYPNGTPFVYTVEFPADTLIQDGGTVTVGGKVYTVGNLEDSNPEEFRNTSRRNAGGWALSLADAINANHKRFADTHTSLVENFSAYAGITNDGKCIVYGRSPADDFGVSSAIPGVTVTQVVAGSSSGSAPVSGSNQSFVVITDPAVGGGLGIVTQPFALPFLITKVITEAVVVPDNTSAFQVGVSGDTNKYFGIFNLIPAMFASGNTVVTTNFASSVPLNPSENIHITTGGPATLGTLKHTVQGVLI